MEDIKQRSNVKIIDVPEARKCGKEAKIQDTINGNVPEGLKGRPEPEDLRFL